MRRIITLLFILSLAGCANYAGLHGHSQKMDAASLECQHVYQKPSIAQAKNPGWWDTFHDPLLNELIAVAIQDSPTMQIAEARIRSADALTQEASSTLWPSIDLSGYAQRERFANLGLIPPPFNGKTFNISELGLNLNYDLDLWGKNRETIKAYMSEAEAARADTAEAALVLSANVANTYFKLCEEISQVELNTEKWKLDKELMQIAMNRGKHGINSNIPIYSLQVRIQSDKQNLEQHRQSEFLARHQLAALLGKNALNTEFETRPFVFHHYNVSLPASLPAHLLAARPDIYAAKLRAEAAAHQVNVAKDRFFPDINLNVLFSYQKIGFNNLFVQTNQNNAISGAIDLPIFDAGARRANLSEKYAEYDRAVDNYNKTLINALNEVADEISLQKTVYAQLKSQNIATNTIQKNYQLYKIRFHHGITAMEEVIEQKTLMLQQQSDQLELQALHLQTVVAMYKALGGHDG